jgi:hypothetical protein
MENCYWMEYYMSSSRPGHVEPNLASRGGNAVGAGRLQQEVEEDAVEELGLLLRRQVPRVRNHLHRRLLPELPACMHWDLILLFISSHSTEMLKMVNK